ncbi:hypothetical protein [Nocardia abscessus]|uniref:hypothetical protein n=1 Tax=Nocardia abscessus TaxID=120957 RepID=UPI0024572ABE|nr:hypothetical protein [Nocardia abscessus]
MESKHEGCIWERTDDNFCSWGHHLKEGYYYLSENGQEFRVIDVIRNKNDPGFEESPIRIISAQKPPFGQWQLIEDQELLEARLAGRKAAETRRENSVEAEKARRLAHLEALPGFRAREHEESLDRAVFSFNLNAKALIASAARYMSTVNDEELGEHFNYEFANALFNFLASVGTLRDVQRVVHRKIWPMRPSESSTCEACGKGQKNPIRSEWEEKHYAPKLAATFTEDAAFLLKLRDYAIHYELPMPNLTTKMSWSKDKPFIIEKTFPLSRDHLLKWNAWGSAAKSFLQSQDEWVDLRVVISNYSKSVKEFHMWFWDQVAAELKFSEYTRKADELRLWLNEKDVKPDWLGTNKPIPPNWNEISRSELRKKRVRAKIDRWAYGSKSWTVHAVDSTGVVTLGPPDEWGALPR